MLNLAQQRCFNHAQREAAARCPQCRRFFCRECVSEHEHRFLCASCIAAATAGAAPRHSPMAGLARIGQFVGGIAILWCSFYVFGNLLLTLPSAFYGEAGDEWLYLEEEGEYADAEGEGEA